jgi:hypothetical protein
MIVPAITFRILSPTVPVNDRFTGLPAISQFCELVTFVVAWALTDLGGAHHRWTHGKFAIATPARCRLCGAIATKSNGIDRLRQEVMS